MPPDDVAVPTYTSMQQQAGLMPAVAIPPPVIFPGQISAMLSAGGAGAAMGALPQMFPGSTYQTMTGAPPMYQGPTGVMQPQMPAAPYNPYSAPNPYAGLGAGGPLRGAPSPFTPMAPAPPPFYAGLQGSGVTPFGPQAAMSQFNTPYAAGLAQQQAGDDRMFAMQAAGAGLAARMGTNALAGLAGAAIGGKFGGGWGAAFGGVAGFLGSEFGGLGQAGQNGFMNQVMGPSIQRRAIAGSMDELSQGFMPFGGALNARGAGFNRMESMAFAGGLQALGGSSSFRAETQDRFNMQDLSKITQGASSAGLMAGVQDASGGVSRVREVAKSLSAIMELAREPDIQRVISTMGNMRASGLNLGETLGAVQNGRMFARMAGTSFGQMAEVGGGMGSATFQSMGLSQGLGLQTGMMNMGIAAASQNSGILNPAMMSMVGGASGLANQNNMFSAGLLQAPMMAPGMMSVSGGLHAGALNGLMSGRADLFSMTGRGANILSAGAGRGGVESLGMNIAMQPYLQDQIGRMMQSQGPMAQRNIEDTQITNMMKQMNMRGSAGFMSAAQIMGMNGSQAFARAQEVASPGYWEGQRQQLGVQRQEARAVADRANEAQRPTTWGTLRRTTWMGEAADSISDAWSHAGTAISRALGTGGETRYGYVASTDEARRRQLKIAGSDEFRQYSRRVTRGADTEEVEGGILDTFHQGYQLAQARGARGIGAALTAPFLGATMSSAQRRAQAREYQQAGEISSALLFTPESQQRDAMKGIGRTFGTGLAGTNAMIDFGTTISRMDPYKAVPGSQGVTGMALNLGVRAGAMFATAGAIDPGNVVGQGANTMSQYRNAFVDSMVTNQGMSRAEAAKRFDANPMLAIQQASPVARLMMRPEDRQRLEATRDIGGQLGSRAGTTRSRVEREIKQGYGALLGEDSSESTRRHYERSMDNINGIGKEGSDKYERSRYIMASMAMASGAMEKGNSEEQKRAVEALAKISKEAAAEGFDVNDMARRAQGLRGKFTEGEGRTTARAFLSHVGSGASGRNIIDNFQNADKQRQFGQTLDTMSKGFGALNKVSGPLGEKFTGITDANFSQEDAESRLKSLSKAELGQMEHATGRDAAFQHMMAKSIRKFQLGDQGAMQEINRMMALKGTEVTKIDNEYKRRHSEGMLSSNYWKDTVRSKWAQEADRTAWVQDKLGYTSEAEYAAAAAGDGSLGTQTMFEKMGIGKMGNAAGQGGDQMLDAARDIKEAASMFKTALQGSSLDSMLNQGGSSDG